VAETNFANLLDNQKTTWAKSVWRSVRQSSFIMQRTGQGMNNAIQRLTELTRSEKGTRAVITLVPDLEGDGVVGDYEIEGNEEEAKAHDQVIQIDQLRNANKIAGRMADQQTVVNFRETSRDLLSFWMSDRVDQLASLTASGMDYRLNTNGSLREGFSHDGSSFSRDTNVSPVGTAFYDLDFAADVTEPSANRHFRWSNSNQALEPGDTTSIAPDDTISYASLVELRAFAKDRRIRSLRNGDLELYHVFLHPKAMAKLKLDQDFLANVRNAGQRGSSNPLFSGSIVTVDGLVLHEFTHSFNTTGAQSGSSTEAGRPGYKWGSDATVDGNRVLLMGGQALAWADIGIPMWDERDHFDYGAKPGIAVSKITGFKKPVFYSPQDGSNEDFGVIAMDVAI
jgi:N4-gp56 family major capsid protein